MIFLTTLLLLLFSSSLFSLGFYTITRGKYITMPDGTLEKEKEIFGEWQLFFEHYSKVRRVYYNQERLETYLFVLHQTSDKWNNHLLLSPEKESLLVSPDLPISWEDIKEIESVLNLKVLYKDGIMFLYEEYPVYDFSEWVRKMTNCPICMGGGWIATIVYWTYLQFNPVFITETIWRILFYPVFCISLAFVNKVIKDNWDAEK